MREVSFDLRIPLIVLVLPLAAGAGQIPGGQPDLTPRNPIELDFYTLHDSPPKLLI